MPDSHNCIFITNINRSTQQHKNIIIIITILLSGCTTISNTVRETQGILNSWISKTAKDLINKKGLPDMVIRMDNKLISHIEYEKWNSSYGLFIEVDKLIDAELWNEQISAWILLYRQEKQLLDGSYLSCTQTFSINHKGIIIKTNEGWVSPNNQNPCYNNSLKNNFVLTRSK